MANHYIVSKARGAGDRLLVLGTTGVRWVRYYKYAVQLAILDLAQPSQVWSRVPHPGDANAFALRNTGRQGWLYLEVDPNAILSMDGGRQEMTWVVLDERADPSGLHGAYWYDDHVQGPYNAIASREDWEQKINIRGDGPYAAGLAVIAYPWDGGAVNELWRFWPATGVPHPGSRVLLTNFEHVVQLGATPERKVYTHPNRDSWETWTVEDAGGGALFLRSAHGTYLGSRQNGEVYVTPNREAWERWFLSTDDGFRLRSAQWSLNLGARPDGSLYTHANRLQWERWWATIV